MPNPILSVKNLTCPLAIGGVPYNVVDNLSFDVELGKTLAIVGESGSGKTMTALCLLGIQPSPPCLPPTGQVLWRGENLLALPEKKLRQIRGSKIAMIFQDPQSSLNPVYTIGWQILESINLHLNLDEDKAYNRAVEALCEVGIDQPELRMNAYPHELSGGMKQRVMIAIALIAEPDILIADEPTTALDVTVQRQVLELMAALQRKKGMALIFITHDMGIVGEIADDVLVMYAAQAVETADVRQLFEHPSHPYTMGLFASRPDPKKPKNALVPISGTPPSLHQFPKGCRFHPRCPYVMPKCKEGNVPFFSVADNQQARCLLYDGMEAQ